MVYYGLAAYDHQTHNKLKESVIPRPSSPMCLTGKSFVFEASERFLYFTFRNSLTVETITDLKNNCKVEKKNNQRTRGHNMEEENYRSQADLACRILFYLHVQKDKGSGCHKITCKSKR